MTVKFIDGLDGYGVTAGTMRAGGLFPEPRKSKSGGNPKAELVINEGGGSAHMDISPPADGEWHAVTVILRREQSGELYMLEPPKTTRWPANDGDA